MPRPCVCRKIQSCPRTACFVPKGADCEALEEVVLTLDELEAVRLTDLDGLYQEQAAQKMNVSRQTLGNIVSAARRKITDCLVNGKSLKIDGGTVQMMTRRTICKDCSHEWDAACDIHHPTACPACRGLNLHQPDEACDGTGQGKCGQGHGACRQNGTKSGGREGKLK